MRSTRVIASAAFTAAFAAGLTPLPAQTMPAPVTGSAIPTAAAIPSHYSGNCPGPVEFVGHIAITVPGTRVDYQWERSDGSKSPVRRLDTGKPAPVTDTVGALKPPPVSVPTVSDRWRVGKPGRDDHFWEKLYVLPPFDIRSTEAPVDIQCNE